jgi:hypothetical protein
MKTEEGKIEGIIRRARLRITNPEHWTWYAIARTRNGDPVPISDPRAVAWCLNGAIGVEAGAVYESPGRLALPNLTDAERTQLREALRSALPARYQGILYHATIDLNNHCSHATVLRYLDRAAEIARAEQKKEDGS